MTLNRVGSIVFSILFTTVLLSLAYAQELYLNGRVVVAGQSETLGTIGVIAGRGDPARLRRLLSMPLPVLSAHPALVPARDLQETLSKAGGSDFVLVGGPLIYLPGSIASEGERTFYIALLREIEKKLPNRSFRITVWASNDRRPTLSNLHDPLQFRFPAGSGSVRALVANNFVRYKGKNDPAFLYLPIHIRIDVLVPIARRKIAFGRKLTVGDVLYQSRDISSLSERTARLFGGSYQTKTVISKDSVIYADMVGRVRAVSAGKQIRIAFRRGNVEVTVPGSAYQSGGLGDTISVAPLRTGTRFRGTIVGPTEVVVEE